MKLRGRLTTRLTMTGPVADPSVDGMLTIAGASFQPGTSGQAVTDGVLILILQLLKTTLLYLRFVIKNLVNYQTILPIKTRVLGEETLNIKSCILPHFYRIKQVNYGQRNKRRTPTEKSTKEPDVERPVLQKTRPPPKGKI